MIDTLHLKDPMPTFYETYRDVIATINRPLTYQDYYDACHHPKDHKRSNDALYAGLPYVIRHMKRNWHTGNERKAACLAAVVPLVGLGLAASAAMFHGPGITASLLIDNYVPMRRRSEAATREDALARAVFRVSQVVTCFAGSRQYHDTARMRPVTQKDLRTVCDVAEGLTDCLRVYRSRRADDRIRHSKSLTRSIRYLDRMTDRVRVHAPQYAQR